MFNNISQECHQLAIIFSNISYLNDSIPNILFLYSKTSILLITIVSWYWSEQCVSLCKVASDTCNIKPLPTGKQELVEEMPAHLCNLVFESKNIVTTE